MFLSRPVFCRHASPGPHTALSSGTRSSHACRAGMKMHSIARLCLAGFGLLLAAGAARAQTAPETGHYALNAAQSSIRFSIGHFYVSSTEGRFTSFDGRLTFAREAPEHGTVTIHV